MTRLTQTLAAGLFALTALAATAATPVASYHFNGSLAADQAGAPALLAIDPQAKNVFEAATVNGVSQTVYHWIGDGASSSTQAGLTLNTAGLLTDNAAYTVAMTFAFDTTAQTGGGWRRLIDTEGRQSDAGFYVSPSQTLETVQIYASGNVLTDGSTSFSTPGFHTVLLSVAPEAGRQRVTAWLDGRQELSTLTDTFTLANANNPGRLLTFFADNLVSNAQQEYANGRIASLALYDGSFTPSAVPEPTTAVLMLAGLGALARLRRRTAG